ncbi:MAG: hypothetical protein AAGH88_00320 [Planctomycetota bacterium]
MYTKLLSASWLVFACCGCGNCHQDISEPPNFTVVHQQEKSHELYGSFSGMWKVFKIDRHSDVTPAAEWKYIYISSDGEIAFYSDEAAVVFESEDVSVAEYSDEPIGSLHLKWGEDIDQLDFYLASFDLETRQLSIDVFDRRFRKMSFLCEAHIEEENIPLFR